MPTGPLGKGPRLWLQPERLRAGATERAVWVIRDGRLKRSTGRGPLERREAEQDLARYLAEKYRPTIRHGDPAQVLTADAIALYARDVAPAHARPRETASRIRRLLTWWADPGAALRWMEANGIPAEIMDGTLADIRTATCRAYVAFVGAPRSARMDLELLRAAINHAVREQLLERPVPVSLPAKSLPRERYLERSEVAQLIWLAWRALRSGNAAGTVWDQLDEALRLREQGKSGAQIAAILGCTRNMVIGQLWRHDQVAEEGGLRTLQHLARWMVVARWTGTRKTAILNGSFEREFGRGFIDLDRGLWHRRGQGVRPTRKRQPPQPIPGPLLAHMRRWRAAGQRYLIEFNGQPIDRIDQAFRRLVKASGLPGEIVPHTFRHTAITWAMQAGMDPWAASGYFGLNLQTLTENYGHHHPDHLREAVAVMGRRRRA